jgi:hypothetical protein
MNSNNEKSLETFLAHFLIINAKSNKFRDFVNMTTKYASGAVVSKNITIRVFIASNFVNN